jgi:DNA-binding transcriptional MerR regulator
MATRTKESASEKMTLLDEINSLITTGRVDAADLFAAAVTNLTLAEIRALAEYARDGYESGFCGSYHAPIAGDEHTRIQQVKSMLLEQLDELNHRLEEMETEGLVEEEAALLSEEQG